MGAVQSQHLWTEADDLHCRIAMSAVVNTLGRSRSWRMLVDGTRDRKVFGLVTVIGSCVMGLAGWGVMSATNRYGKDMEQDLKKNRSMAQMHTAKNNGRGGVQKIFNQLPPETHGAFNQEAPAANAFNTPVPAPAAPAAKPRKVQVAKPPQQASQASQAMQAVLQKTSPSLRQIGGVQQQCGGSSDCTYDEIDTRFAFWLSQQLVRSGHLRLGIYGVYTCSPKQQQCVLLS